MPAVIRLAGPARRMTAGTERAEVRELFRDSRVSAADGHFLMKAHTLSSMPLHFLSFSPLQRSTRRGEVVSSAVFLYDRS